MSDGIRKTNQDIFFKETIVLEGEKTTLLVVMDGHGTEGHKCSSNLKSNIRQVFTSTFLSFLETKIAFKQQKNHDEENQNTSEDDHNQIIPPQSQRIVDWDLFDYQDFFTVFCKRLNTILCSNKKLDSDMSGSTGIFIWGVNDKLVSANVGDSRAILL